MYLLFNLSHYVKSYGHFCQILAFFTMLAHQIWSCHVTQEANFKIFLFCPNLTFNIEKVTKFLMEKLATSEVISQNLTGGGGGVGGKHLLVPLGLRYISLSVPECKLVENILIAFSSVQSWYHP